MKENSGKKSVSRNEKRIIIIVVSAILLLCLCCFCSVVGSVGMLGYLYELEDSNYEYYEDESFDLLDVDQEGFRKYIDPEIDEEVEDLLIKSRDKFIFVYSDYEDFGLYDEEEKFLLVNLQYEYDRLSSIFEFEVEDEVTILFTDEQEEFENRMGFDYQEELAIAGNTLFREIQFFVHPDKVYSNTALFEIVSHELVHLFQVEGTNDALYPYPRWFSEGTAEYFSYADKIEIGNYSRSSEFSTLTDVTDAMESGVIEDTQASYNLSYHFVDYLVDKHGEQKVKKLIFPDIYSEGSSAEGYLSSKSFVDNYFTEFGVYPTVDYEQWHKSVFENQ